MAFDAKGTGSGSWEQILHDAGTKAEEEVRRVVQYINDEVVPDVRRNGSEALKAAARELHKLAERMDDQARRTSQAPPGSSAAKDEPK